MDKNVTVKTRNRKLEQILFDLGIHHLAWEKDDDGMTVWTYQNTNDVQYIMDMFRRANDNKRKAGW